MLGQVLYCLPWGGVCLCFISSKSQKVHLEVKSLHTTGTPGRRTCEPGCFRDVGLTRAGAQPDKEETKPVSERPAGWNGRVFREREELP